MIPLPDSLPAPEDVPDKFVEAVVERWCVYVHEQMGREYADLVDCQPWLYVESMQYLMDALLVTLGAAQPVAVSFSFMNSIAYDGECEVLVVWQEDSAGYLDPFLLELGCSVMLMTDYPWPAMIKFLTDEDERSLLIKRWTWLMSAAVADMPKGQT